MKRTLLVFLTLLLCPWGDPAIGYPLDASEETGIARLAAYEMAKSVLLEKGTLKPGSFWSSDQIQLRLLGAGFNMPEPDPELTAKIRDMVGSDAPYYGISVLDITDPEHPRLAEINGRRSQNPGSVGKLMVALAWFQTLADIYPDDIDARKRILYETQITANGFIINDSHVVPFYRPGDPMVVRRPIEIGDTANLWTWFDWMCSASSNAAGSQLISELVLLKKFGREYPVSPEVAEAFFEKTPQKELTRILLDALETPIPRNGLDLQQLRQGSFFTREGKRRIPGTSSVSTSSALLRYLTLMEQGELVDPFSSLEIKKLIYLTDIRIRYAASPALDDAAVYFKSGSLYSCKPEPGYQCGKYRGNKWNFLNSATIVETSDSNQRIHYIVVVLSNVLKKDSAEQHENLAAAIHHLMQQLHPPKGEPSI